MNLFGLSPWLSLPILLLAAALIAFLIGTRVSA